MGSTIDKIASVFLEYASAVHLERSWIQRVPINHQQSGVEQGQLADVGYFLPLLNFEPFD